MNKSKIQAVIKTIQTVFDNGGVVGFSNADMLIGCVIALEQLIKEDEADVLDGSGNPGA